MFYRQKFGHSQKTNEIGRAEKIIILGSGGKGGTRQKRQRGALGEAGTELSELSRGAAAVPGCYALHMGSIGLKWFLKL